MTKPFQFFVREPGTPNQTLVFDQDGEPTQTFPIPDLVIPSDQTERFWLLRGKLIEFGAIPDIHTTYNP